MAEMVAVAMVAVMAEAMAEVEMVVGVEVAMEEVGTEVVKAEGTAVEAMAEATEEVELAEERVAEMVVRVARSHRRVPLLAMKSGVMSRCGRGCHGFRMPTLVAYRDQREFQRQA